MESGLYREVNMGYIDKMPYILGLLMPIIIGCACISLGYGNREIYFRMFISAIVFIIIGVIIRNILINARKKAVAKLLYKQVSSLNENSEEKKQE